MNDHNYLWIKIGVAVAMATSSLVTFVYSTFETKDHAQEVMSHLIRIEAKVDRILEK